MAPSRKSRSVNKRFSYINEATSNKNGENTNKSRQRVSIWPCSVGYLFIFYQFMQQGTFFIRSGNFIILNRGNLLELISSFLAH